MQLNSMHQVHTKQDKGWKYTTRINGIFILTPPLNSSPGVADDKTNNSVILQMQEVEEADRGNARKRGEVDF